MAVPGSLRSVATPIPWLSGLLLLACVVFSVDARVERDTALRESAAALEVARRYVFERPYLEPAPDLAARLDTAALARERRDHERRRRELGLSPAPLAVGQRQQAVLDDLTADLRDAQRLRAPEVAVAADEGFSSDWLLHVLLHTNQIHLVGNGVLLLLLGLYLERSLGRLPFVAAVATLGVAGAAAWITAGAGPSQFGLAGSSPLLAGLLAAFAVRFARERGQAFYSVAVVCGALWLLLPPWAATRWSLAAIVLTPVGIAPEPTLVYWAFLGAALAGVGVAACAWLLGLDGERFAEGSSRVIDDPRFRQAMRAREASRPREALELLGEYVEAEPDAYEAALVLRELAEQLGHRLEATQASLRVIQIELQRELHASACDRWIALVKDGIPEEADPELLIHMALALRERGWRDAAVHALGCALERSEERENHEMAARIARAARGLDPEIAETAAWRALGSVELELEERQALEDLIAEVLTPPGEPARAYGRSA